MKNTPNHTRDITFIDTHCHLDDERYIHDLDFVIDNARSLGVAQIIIPAANPDTLERAKNIANKYENIYFACGIHPCDIDNDKDYLQFIDDKKCVAIGECGLDYYHLAHLDSAKKEQQKQRQKESFITQIKLSIKHNLPLIVHIREASNDAYEILSEFKEARGVLHCYNADRILLQLSDRFCYGIGGVATFKNARRLLEALPLIPKDRIVLETDAPYLTPHPHRGERNTPEFIPLIAQRVAEILEVDIQDFADCATRNAKNLFALS
ncbi:TatD family hydrolase [Helicobacter fennelliae]|uniref:TatD family hydrolase n=2 Tax=Helicobacter fennelliae TaxID=215 RepID=A0A2X3BFB2_9HELI|nr:TatD family hydrolase [Helicobacter fennelliae]GAD19541.1 putative deoxyribonuclease YcfH [Helicobacter fennelliae MRY12-0050]SQB98484.1 TatD family hydrolase [Helicobacter fennelliae]STP07847.1 TatD family hydrolase [Helicobacter fennelliae]STQ84268.1 TatD family hydrolase [Helicobacter fennelliae]